MESASAPEDSVVLAGPYAEQRLRALKTGVDMFRPRAGTSGAHQGAAARGAARAQRAAADGRRGITPDAALCRRAPSAAVMRPSAGCAAPGVRKGGRQLPEDGAIDSATPSPMS